MTGTTSETTFEPRGELAIRTSPRPADTNARGDIFGGWLLSQMDVAGGLTAQERARGRVATVAIDSMAFHRPVFVGDVLCVYADLVRVGRSSMSYRIEAWVIRHESRERVKVTEGIFTFVAIDENGKPRPVPPAGAEA